MDTDCDTRDTFHVTTHSLLANNQSVPGLAHKWRRGTRVIVVIIIPVIKIIMVGIIKFVLLTLYIFNLQETPQLWAHQKYFVNGKKCEKFATSKQWIGSIWIGSTWLKLQHALH